MPLNESHDALISRASELFYETDEPIYPTLINYPWAYPIRWTPYDLGEAAFEALLEDDPFILRGGGLELVRRKMALEAEMQATLEDWESISVARRIAAMILNNYGGPGSSFSPN